MTFQTEPLARPAGGRELWTGISTAAARAGNSRTSGALVRVLNWAWPLALVTYLVWYLVGLGWAEIWQALPAAWMVFALIPVLYLLPAAGDLLIYRSIWQAGDKLKLPVMLRKNTINTTVFGLSGEFYLVVWARRHIPRSQKFIMHSVTDSNALSTLAGWILLSSLLIFLAATDDWSIPMMSADLLWLGLVLASVPSMIVFLVVAARRITTVLTRKQLLFTLAVHAIRTALGYTLLVSIWCLAIPSVPLVVWLNFLALRLLIACVAMIPNRELLWLGAGVGIAGFMELPQASIAAMLIAMTAGEYICHLVFVGLPALVGKARAALSPRPAV